MPATSYLKTASNKLNDLLLKAQEMARVGYWLVDLKTNAIAWSDITRQIHEVPEDYKPVLEEGIKFYKEGHHRDTITQAVQDAIEKGTPWDLELIIVTATGRECWVKAKGEAEFENGEAVRLIGTFQDIDKRKRAQLQVEQISSRLAFATKTAQIGIWEYYAQSNHLIWDDNMYALYGIDREQFEAKFEVWQGALHPADKVNATRELDKTLTEGKDFNTLFRIVTPNGDIKHIKAHASLVRNAAGAVEKLIGVNIDVTENIETKIKLEQSQAVFSRAFEHAHIGMAVTDSVGKIINANQYFNQLVEYSEPELRNLVLTDLIYSELPEEKKQKLADALPAKQTTVQLEKKLITKNLRLVDALLTITAIMNEYNSVEQFFVQVVDITMLKEKEKKEKELREITENQNESLMNFTYIVSHNLRTHCSNLRSLSEILKYEDDDIEREKVIDMLIMASSGLNETVDSLNEVVDIRSTVMNDLKALNLNRFAIKISQDIALLLQKENAKVQIAVNEDHNIKAIPSYLESILLNLYTNAIKYKKPDSVPVMHISSERDTEYTYLRFSDQGLGIDLNKYGSKIFGMFKTFHHNKDAKGIGLFISKNQIEAMGGSIDIESKINVGTTFTLKFLNA